MISKRLAITLACLAFIAGLKFSYHPSRPYLPNPWVPGCAVWGLAVGYWAGRREQE